MASKKEQTGYKAVNLINGEFASFHKPTVKYHIGKPTRQRVKPNHEKGLYLYQLLSDAITYAKNSHPKLAIVLYCKYHKPMVDYHGKIAASVVIPISVLGFVIDGEYNPVYGDCTWLINHLTKYEAGKLPPQPAEIICGNQVFHINDCNAVKRGRCRELLKALKVEV